MTPDGNNFDHFAENQLTNFRIVKTVFFICSR